jgi:hypothetical protein
MSEVINILFFLGLIMAIVGFYEGSNKCPKSKTIVKFVDRTLEEAQIEAQSPNSIFLPMFTDPPLLF